MAVGKERAGPPKQLPAVHVVREFFFFKSVCGAAVREGEGAACFDTSWFTSCVSTLRILNMHIAHVHTTRRVGRPQVCARSTRK